MLEQIDEDVGHLAIEPVGPNVAPGLGVDELGGDAEAVVDALRAAIPSPKWAPYCINDKWNVSDSRCVNVPDDLAAMQKSAEDCVGSFEYMPDQTWKGAGTCTVVFNDGDKLYESWEEGSHLKESTFKITGGTGTYVYELLTDTLSGGRYKGTIELP